MLPGPATASPPETDHVTGAAAPFVDRAAKRWTGKPRALLALQRLQLVSMAAVAGEMEKAELTELAVTVAVPQPATAIRNGAATREPTVSTNRRRPTRMGENPVGIRIL